MLEKCLLTALELILNQRLGHKKTKLNICRHMLTSSTQLQNKSFQFTSWKERERLQNVKRWKMHVQCAQKYCFSLSNMQICRVFVVVSSRCGCFSSLLRFWRQRKLAAVNRSFFAFAWKPFVQSKRKCTPPIFAQRDQHGIIAKDVTVTQSSILMRSSRCGCRPSFLNSLLAISGAPLSFG